jgi:hypothetical protein
LTLPFFSKVAAQSNRYAIQEDFRMFVPSYQMHNVLNVFSKKLKDYMSLTKSRHAPEKASLDRIKLSSAEKRRATIEKVTQEIFDKITRCNSQAESRHGITRHFTASTNKKNAKARPYKKGFVFNVIDAINKKRTSTLSVEDSSDLIRRLDQLSKNTKNHQDGESWIGSSGGGIDHPAGEFKAYGNNG